MRVTASDNGITNAIEVAELAPGGGALRVLCSNNDDAVRAFDAATFQLVRCGGDCLAVVRRQRLCGGRGAALHIP